MNRDFRRLCFVVLLLIAVFRIGVRAQDSASVGKLPIEQLQKLADSGDPAAQNELGIRYRLGTDIEKDPAKAIPWFMKAAKQGYAKAYFNMGAAYYNGDGLPVNDQDSCVWFMLSADSGDQRGQEALARARQEMSPPQMKFCELTTATVYLTGEIIKQDYAKAMEKYAELANAGDGAACEKLAYMYDRGLGVPKDDAQSLNWLKRAADLNYVPAIFELGYAYDKGHNAPEDVDKARKLYERAADYGYPDALIALGNMYAEGRGAKLDRQEALSYYFAAAGFGSTDGKSLAEKLAAQLNPKQVASAKDEAKKIASKSRHPLVLVRK